jgi:hypothetical protein
MQAALLSIPKLCDAGCTAHFSETDVVIMTQDGTVALIGRRDPLTKLWEVPLTPHHDDPTKQHSPSETTPKPTVRDYAHNAYKQRTKQDLLTFLHAAAGSPTVATWCTTTDKGFYPTWPDLTSTLVRKYLPKALATFMGHLHMQRQGVPSTQIHRPSETTPKPTVSDYAHNAYKQRTKQDLLAFLHAAAGSPTVATWCTTIDKGFYPTWPGLTSTLVRKYLPKALATFMGHLHMQRQGVRSTQNTPQPSTDFDDVLPPPQSHIDRTHHVGAHLLNLHQPGPQRHDRDGSHWPTPLHIKPMHDLPFRAVQL